MVVWLYDFASQNRLQVFEIENHSRDRIGISAQCDLNHVIVPVPMRVGGGAIQHTVLLVVELRQGGKVVTKRTVTASEGAPGRGTFSTSLVAPEAGAATIAAYAPSAADGTPQHEQDVPVVVKP